MKHISESIIGRKGAPVWPNPYGLTEKDAKGKIEGWPLEIITLALHEIYLLRDNFDLTSLQRYGLNYAFVWEKSEDGHDFWESIRDEKFDIFYDKYTPAKLRERLEEK